MFSEKIIKSFCMTEKEFNEHWSRKRQVLKPFNRWHYTYATNGICAIKIPRVRRYDKNDNKVKVEKVFPKEKDCGTFLKIDSEILKNFEQYYSQKNKIDIIIIHGIKFDKKFIKKFLVFENVNIALNPYDKYGNIKPAYIKFKGGCGLLCPLRKM